MWPSVAGPRTNVQGDIGIGWLQERTQLFTTVQPSQTLLCKLGARLLLALESVQPVRALAAKKQVQVLSLHPYSQTSPASVPLLPDSSIHLLRGHANNQRPISTLTHHGIFIQAYTPLRLRGLARPRELPQAHQRPPCRRLRGAHPSASIHEPEPASKCRLGI